MTMEETPPTIEPIETRGETAADISTAEEAEIIFQAGVRAGEDTDTVYTPTRGVDLGFGEEGAFERSVNDPGFRPTT